MVRTFLAVIVAGITPVLVLTLIVTGTGFGLVLWQPPNKWTVHFGTPDSYNELNVLSSDSTGIYVAGSIGDSGLRSVQAIPSYLLLARFDLDGRQIWTRQLGILNISYAYAIAVGSNSVFVAGLLNGRDFIRKFDLNGNEAQYPTGGGIDIRALSVGPNGLFAAGESTGSAYNNGVQSLILKEYDFNGNTLWTKVLGNSTGSRPSLFSSSTGVYVTSPVSCSDCNSVVARYEFNGTLDWTRDIKDSSNSTLGWTSNSISSDSTGIYVGGSYYIGRVGVGFIQKYDLNGKQLWTTSIASPDYSSLGEVYLSANSSGVYLTTDTGAGHPFLMKYDGNGNQLWSFQIPTAGRLSAGENNVYVAGGLKTGEAYLASFSQSSSLILFGVNPPFSFLLLGAIAGTIVLIILWKRRKWEQKYRKHYSCDVYRSRNRPTATPAALRRRLIMPS